MDIFLIIFGITGLILSVWVIINEPKLRAKSDNLLVLWGKKYNIERIFYGNDKNNRPDHNCFWDKNNYPVGWYETDFDLRKRIVKKLQD